MKKNEKNFKRLQNQWYQRLKDEGFQDIEDTSSSEPLLNEWSFNFFRTRFNLIVYETDLKYYEQARKLLLSYPFKNQDQKMIWELHCEGLSEREIAKRVTRYQKSMVHYVIAGISRVIKND